VDDGRPDRLHVVVEIKGYRRGDAQLKAETIRKLWVPGVNNLGQFGRWTFAEFTTVFEIDARFNELIEQLSAAVPIDVAA
jgi:type III restriction enzyme